MATMNTADIGFEREIWKAADKMRGNIDASVQVRCVGAYFPEIYFR